jgi:acyl carrier protein
MDDFYEKIAEILELDTLNPSDELANFPEWDSLSVLSVIAMIGANYGVNLTASDLRGAATAQAIRDLVARKSGR